MLNITLAEARRRLDEVRTLSVVKIRPEDQRTYLQNEMYSLLHRHIYDSPYDSATQKVAFDAIRQYYKQQRELVSERLNKLYAPVEEHGRESLDLRELGKMHIQYQTLLTEIMYYYLCYDLGRGFRSYYRFSHEAIMARDLMMDLQLQAELLSYLSKPPAPILETDISVRMILETLKTRPPARAWMLGDYQSGVDEAHVLIEKHQNALRKRIPCAFGGASSYGPPVCTFYEVPRETWMKGKNTSKRCFLSWTSTKSISRLPSNPSPIPCFGTRRPLPRLPIV